VEVFYATDRKRAVSEKPSEIYGADSSDELQLGRLEVSIPKGHKLGNLESPSMLHFEFHEDPKKHIVLLEVGPPLSEAAWTTGIDNRLNASTEKAALLFIHGFDDTFEFAARRTAQLACDLSLDGVPLMFSWPSQGTESGYPADEDRVMTSVPDLKQVLTLIRTKTQAKVVHVIAHSMGNRVLCNALREFALEKADLRLDQVILAAPDVYTDLFRRQLAPEIVKVCKRVSLYASSEDKALLLSMKLHRDPRAGLSGHDRCLAPGIDTIDASTIDTSLIGHGYFAENRTVMDDIFLVLRHQFAPNLRHLVRNGDDPAVYWTFP
jgi:esterase/lipase superfamily enzyme